MKRGASNIVKRIRRIGKMPSAMAMCHDDEPCAVSNEPSNEQDVAPRACIRVHAPQKQDTGKFRANRRDKFYTSEAVAMSCIQRIIRALPCTRDYLWVEPSAGSGSFLHNLPPSFERVGLDLEPNAPDILERDYLLWTPPPHARIVVFGNPPFGRQSSLAKAFIAKSCEFAQIIAFILPKSFTKPSMFGAFTSKFHLIQSTDLAKSAFLINGSPYDVPCVFQIWKKENVDRAPDAKVRPSGFEYVKSADAYHIALRRVGGLAGRCYKRDGGEFSAQSHYFIRWHPEALDYSDRIVDRINGHTFPSNTVGPRSLSKSEASIVINDIIRVVLTDGHAT